MRDGFLLLPGSRLPMSLTKKTTFTDANKEFRDYTDLAGCSGNGCTYQQWSSDPDDARWFLLQETGDSISFQFAIPGNDVYEINMATKDVAASAVVNIYVCTPRVPSGLLCPSWPTLTWTTATQNPSWHWESTTIDLTAGNRVIKIKNANGNDVGVNGIYLTRQ